MSVRMADGCFLAGVEQSMNWIHRTLNFELITLAVHLVHYVLLYSTHSICGYFCHVACVHWMIGYKGGGTVRISKVGIHAKSLTHPFLTSYFLLWLMMLFLQCVVSFCLDLWTGRAARRPNWIIPACAQVQLSLFHFISPELRSHIISVLFFIIVSVYYNFSFRT